MDTLLEHLGRGFMVMLLLSMPSVLTAAAIGLVIGILQAVTQVQEQTIAAAPKILGVFLVIVMMGQFSVTTLSDYLKTSVNIAFGVIPRDEQTILTGSEFNFNKKTEEDRYYQDATPSVKEIMKRSGRVPHDQDK